jgi:hypothetical protein
MRTVRECVAARVTRIVQTVSVVTTLVVTTLVATVLTAPWVPLRAQAPTPPNLVGKVTGPGGEPLGNVEVRLRGTEAVTRSNDAGMFAFVNVPNGPAQLMFRRVGYMPTVIGVAVPQGRDSLEVALAPTTTRLDTVNVTADVQMLAGVVVDEHGSRIPGAQVDMAGTKRVSTTTDADGWFTLTAPHKGPVLLRARRQGFGVSTVSVNLDGWRGVVMRLERLDATLPQSKMLEKSGFGVGTEVVWEEATRRMVQRSARSAIVPREELAALSGMSLGQALRASPSGQLATTQLDLSSTRACVLLDGRRVVGFATLDLYRADDVEFVELYPPGTEPSGTVARYLRNAGCGESYTPGGRLAPPFFAVIWLRD